MMSMMIESAALDRALFSHGDLRTLTVYLRAENSAVVNLRGDLYVDDQLETDGETAAVRFRLCRMFSAAENIPADGEIYSRSYSFYVKSSTIDPFQEAVLEERALAVSLRLTATDDNGETSYADVPLNAVLLNRWIRPSVDYFSVERCANGSPMDDGTSVIAGLRISTADGRTPDGFSLTLDWGESADLSDSIPAAMDGITASSSLISAEFAAEQDWKLRITFGDAYEQAVATADLARAFANLHLSGRANGGACFGGFSTSTDDEPKFECHFPAYFYGGISGVNLYSEDETKTGGRWIDGKDIFMRVVKVPAIAAATTSVNNVIATIDDLDTLIDVQGMVVSTAGNRFPLCFRSITTGTNTMDMYVNALGGIVIRTGSSMVIAGGYLVCFYTRKADVA